jgi:hypothetical protein
MVSALIANRIAQQDELEHDAILNENVDELQEGAA